MKKKTETGSGEKKDLHALAEEYREMAEIECFDCNEDLERDVIAEFEKSETAQYFRDNAPYVTGLAVERLERVRDGKSTYPFRPFDAETIVRLLSTSTEAPYEAKGFDSDLSDAETVDAWELGSLVRDDFSTSTETPSTALQSRLRKALQEYATAAASYAKHIGSASLLEWAEILDILSEGARWYCGTIDQEKALRVIELEKSAADRLRLDRIVSGLPRFRPPRKARK